MSSCPRKPLRSICTACHPGPANSFSGRSSPPPFRCSREGKLLVPASQRTSDTSRQAGQCLINRNSIYNSFQTPGPWRLPPGRRGRDSSPGVPGPSSSRRCSLLFKELQLCWTRQNPGGGGGWGGVRTLPQTVPFNTSSAECRDGSGRGETGWGGIGLATFEVPVTSSDSSECLLWGLRLCWEKYLNLPLIPAASPKICLGLVPYFSLLSPSPPLHMKGAMEGATGPNAEPPALFFCLL